VVIRPDSGDPRTVPIEVIALLAKQFGTTTNAQGYRVLPPQVRVIQGDGIDLDSIQAILANLEAGGWSADNLAFGMGGALLQQSNRDTLRFALKCSEAVVNGVPREVYKQPSTDAGKGSKRGRLALVRTPEGSYTTVPEADAAGEDLLQTVFENGVVTHRQTLAEVRARAGVTLT
jgi:nicotinamide phosphoribosyltransferase